MAKIMLVEDDNNLREIYEARLLAEGYEIIAAHDGEEALALAIKEKPDLIISDVMMPKISGFDMLDILRSTTETKNVKVIMMTALSQAEDKDRADKLGADRYLVKSQVTLEDVAKIAREVLESDAPAATPDPVTQIISSVADPLPVVAAPVVAVTPAVPPVAVVVPTPDPAPVVTPAVVVAAPVVAPSPDPITSTTSALDAVQSAQSAVSEKATVTAQVDDFVKDNVTSTNENNDKTEPAVEPAKNSTASERTIQPLSDPKTAPDLTKLVAAEERKNLQAGTTINPTDTPVDDPNLISL